MPNCVNCGRPVPEGQNVCSMCYGDPYYGTDGYYLAELQRQAEEEAMWEQAREQERDA